MTEESRPGFVTRMGKALTRTLSTIILFFFAVVLLIGLAVGLAYGAQELNVLANKARRVDLLRDDVNRLDQELREQRGEVVRLQGELNDRDIRLAELENNEDLSQDLARQAEMLAALTDQVAGLADGSQNNSDNLAALGEGLVALQTDLNENGSRIDSLGGQLDGLSGSLGALSAEVNEMNSAPEEPDEALLELRRSLAIFRVWELVARARLHLAEGNPGLAAADIELALAGVTSLTGEAAAEQTADYQTLQIRLQLALAGLPGDPDTAALDLDGAWQALDRLLARLVLPATAPEEAAPIDEAPPAEATPTATPTS